MNIHHVVIFCFLSALCGGNSGLVSANPPVYTGPEGGSGTINCYLTLSGSWRFFCKNKCKEEDVLIRTDGVRANSGRYSTEYKDGSSGRGILSVTITHLTQSDSGRYRCGLGKSSVPDSYTDFEVRVSDGLLDKNSGFIRTNIEGDNLTYPCRDSVNRSRTFFCRGDCKKQEDILIETDEDSAQRGRYGIKYIEGSVFGLYATITQVVKSDSGQYRCGYGRTLSPDSYHTFSILVDELQPHTNKPGPVSTSAPESSSAFPATTGQFTVYISVPRPRYFLPLVVCVPLVFVLLAVFLLVLHQWKKRRNSGLNAGGNHHGVAMESSAIYENWAPASRCEDSIYQNFNPASRDQDQAYLTRTKTEHNL
ncbi:polymeric immunoglobulin receptor-like [Trachinotus anak]|uniref:polymeric immunoglobulin receptor-like n=1 Tax=Trachinotus anak TaxID=443729 RepID=UPI0039F25A95